MELLIEYSGFLAPVIAGAALYVLMMILLQMHLKKMLGLLALFNIALPALVSLQADLILPYLFEVLAFNAFCIAVVCGHGLGREAAIQKLEAKKEAKKPKMTAENVVLAD